MSAGPVLLTGLADTGKSALARLLTHRTSFVVVRHTRLWRTEGARGLDLPATRPWLDTLLDDPATSRLLPDVDHLRARTADGATVAEVLDALHLRYARQLGGRRWGEQCGAGVVDVTPILEALPTARAVHLVRHPAVAYTVAATRRERGIGSLGRFTARWMAAVDRACGAAARFPDRTSVIRFETLATDPDGTIRGICRFLGEPVDRRPLELAPSPQPPAPPTDAVVTFVERHAGTQLRWAGYRPSMVPARSRRSAGPAVERLALAVSQWAGAAPRASQQEVAR